MAQSKDLGQKFTCFECECKFYDLGAPEPICPRCGADQREAPETPTKKAPAAKKRTRKAATKKAATPKPELKVAEPEDEGSLLDDDFDDASLEEGLKAAVAERMPEGEEPKAKAKPKAAAKAKPKAAAKAKPKPKAKAKAKPKAKEKK